MWPSGQDGELQLQREGREDSFIFRRGENLPSLSEIGDTDVCVCVIASPSQLEKVWDGSVYSVYLIYASWLALK